jgi:hypothetical protein
MIESRTDQAGDRHPLGETGAVERYRAAVVHYHESATNPKVRCDAVHERLLRRVVRRGVPRSHEAVGIQIERVDGRVAPHLLLLGGEGHRL